MSDSSGPETDTVDSLLVELSIIVGAIIALNAGDSMGYTLQPLGFDIIALAIIWLASVIVVYAILAYLLSSGTDRSDGGQIEDSAIDDGL